MNPAIEQKLSLFGWTKNQKHTYSKKLRAVVYELYFSIHRGWLLNTDYGTACSGNCIGKNEEKLIEQLNQIFFKEHHDLIISLSQTLDVEVLPARNMLIECFESKNNYTSKTMNYATI